MKFRKKYDTAEAVRWTGHNLDEVTAFLTKKASPRFWQNGSLITVGTGLGDVTAGPGMWFVVTEVGLSVLDDKVFHDYYEPAKAAKKEDAKEGDFR